MKKEQLMHRRAKSGKSLCGEKVLNANMTLYDSKVNCPPCSKILLLFSKTDDCSKISRKNIKGEKNDRSDRTS